MLKILPFIGAALLASCSQMPQLSAPEPSPGPAPTIQPLSGLLAQMPAPGSILVVDSTGLSARAARLRARADGLRGPVTPPAIGG